MRNTGLLPCYTQGLRGLDVGGLYHQPRRFIQNARLPPISNSPLQK